MILTFSLPIFLSLITKVKVVGATCAACPFPCLNNVKFPVVMLDECSQMTEPASLLPIARYSHPYVFQQRCNL